MLSVIFVITKMSCIPEAVSLITDMVASIDICVSSMPVPSRNTTHCHTSINFIDSVTFLVKPNQSSCVSVELSSSQLTMHGNVYHLQSSLLMNTSKVAGDPELGVAANMTLTSYFNQLWLPQLHIAFMPC